MGFGILELFWNFIILIQGPGNVLEFSHYARSFGNQCIRTTHI